MRLSPRRVDRLWSVTPIFYAAHFAAAADWAPRPALMAALALVWGLRLSWNFARKAGYQARGPRAAPRALDGAMPCGALTHGSMRTR